MCGPNGINFNRKQEEMKSETGATSNEAAKVDVFSNQQGISMGDGAVGRESSSLGQTAANDEQPRIIAGAVPGRIVHYVMRDGISVRPFMLISVSFDLASGVLFFSKSDIPNLPMPLLPGPSGHAAENSVVLVAGFDDVDRRPGTWHWPLRESVMASSVEPNALEVQVVGIMEGVLANFRRELLQAVTDKNLATVEAVNHLLEAAALGKLAEAAGEIAGCDGGKGASAQVGGPVTPPVGHGG